MTSLQMIFNEWQQNNYADLRFQDATTKFYVDTIKQGLDVKIL